MNYLNTLKNLYTKYPVRLFLTTNFFISWSIITLYSLGQSKLINFKLSKVFLIVIAQFGPLLAVIILSRFFEKKQKIKDIFKRATNIKEAGIFWIIFTVLLFPIIFLISSIINYLFGGQAPDFPNESNWLLLIGNFRHLYTKRDKTPHTFKIKHYY